MGLYIKDMEMPEHCGYCRFRYDGICHALQKTQYSMEECPLIPVPPHGRLIDADALLMRINHEVMEAYMDGACYGVHPSQEYLYLLGEIIDDAPTIIPASEADMDSFIRIFEEDDEEDGMDSFIRILKD